MNYTNLPLSSQASSSDTTVQVFDQYYNLPVQLNSAVLTAAIGVFESKGFDSYAAEMIAIAICTQAKRDNLNTMELLDNFAAIDKIEINDIISSIVNYNRYKSSLLGVRIANSPNNDVIRNIKP